MDRLTRQARGRDDILRILGSGKVRVLTSDQVTTYWFGHTKEPRRHAMRCLRALKADGAVELQPAMLTPVDVSQPLYRWPEDGPPNCGQIAWQAKARFQVPPERTVIVLPKGSSRFRQPPRPTELQHDTMLASVFLNALVMDPSIFETWRSEDEVRDRLPDLGHIPDAIIVEPTGHTFVECVGKYSTSKIEAIHKAFRGTAHRFY